MFETLLNINAKHHNGYKMPFLFCTQMSLIRNAAHEKKKKKKGRGTFNVSSRVWNAQLDFLQIIWRANRMVFLRFRFVFPRRQRHGVRGTKKWGRNIIKMDEMREGRTQSDWDKKENNRKMCSVHTHTRTLKPDRVREIWFSLGGEFCVFKREWRICGEGKEGGYDELILPHHWSHRNVNLLVHRLEWII